MGKPDLDTYKFDTSGYVEKTDGTCLMSVKDVEELRAACQTAYEAIIAVPMGPDREKAKRRLLRGAERKLKKALKGADNG